MYIDIPKRAHKILFYTCTEKLKNMTFVLLSKSMLHVKTRENENPSPWINEWHKYAQDHLLGTGLLQSDPPFLYVDIECFLFQVIVDCEGDGRGRGEINRKIINFGSF